MTRVLSVRLGEVEVGTLAEDPAGRIGFRMHSSYIDRPDRPVLGQKFEDDPGRTWTEVRGIPRWFANLLPEADSPTRRLLEEANQVPPGDDLGLLGALGGDLPGALVVGPENGEDSFEVQDLEIAPKPAEDVSLRFSLAGVQLKFSVVTDGERVRIAGRDEDGGFILKVEPGDRLGVAENEAAMLAWASLAGFETASGSLVPMPADLPGIPPSSLARYALLVRRFDRRPGARVHQEDFAQIAHVQPAQKYDILTFEKMGSLVLGVLGEEGLAMFFRRLALMVAQGNADAHLKNWSVQYLDRISPSWAPLYDLVSTICWPDVDNRIALKLAGVREFTQVRESDFQRLAERIGVPGKPLVHDVRDAVEAIRAAWPTIRENYPLPPGHAARIAAHWRGVPLLGPLG